MARILTGVQSTGIPHLGNILGAMEPAVQLANQAEHEAFLFIANLHSFTNIKDKATLVENTYATACTWLAMGFDHEKNVFYRQSDVPEVTELMWYLNCFMPYSRLQLAHSFKDKAERADLVNAGLFTYPVLMAADILLYDAEVVPVGKDQEQHLEFTRELARKFNNEFGSEEEELLKLPEVMHRKETMYVPGTDGQKMSKSYGNFINLFVPDKKLRKQVMGVVTDSTPLEEPKDPDTCVVFSLFELVAEANEIEEMRENYKRGGFGYGHAKQALFEVMVRRFQDVRERYAHYNENRDEVDRILREGADKARSVASGVLQRVRGKIGY